MADWCDTGASRADGDAAAWWWRWWFLLWNVSCFSHLKMALHYRESKANGFLIDVRVLLASSAVRFAVRYHDSVG
jgi:hypothetical protein